MEKWLLWASPKDVFVAGLCTGMWLGFGLSWLKGKAEAWQLVNEEKLRRALADDVRRMEERLRGGKL